jgi:branched-chain amino acid transport system substrate-binding protein
MKRLLSTVLLALSTAALAQGQPIKIGEINSYSSMPQFTTPYRQGWQLAVEEINAKGGLLGRRVEVIARDDAGKPEDALRHAIELTANERVDVLAGGFLSNVGLALADHAQKNKRLFVASEPLTDALVWDKGNRYTFRLRPSTYMQAAMLVEEAANLPAKRWGYHCPQLRVWSKRGGEFQGVAQGPQARCGVCGRAVAGAGQARCRQYPAGHHPGQA